MQQISFSKLNKSESNFLTQHPIFKSALLFGIIQTSLAHPSFLRGNMWTDVWSISEMVLTMEKPK